MELRPIHVASFLSMVATAAIVTGCGGAIQPGALTSASTVGTPNVAYSSLMMGVPQDPTQAALMQGKLVSTGIDGTRKFVIELSSYKKSSGYVSYGTYYSAPVFLDGLQGLAVPVLNGSAPTSQSLSMSSFSPVAVFPNDTLEASATGGWGSYSSGFNFTFTFNGNSSGGACSSVDLTGKKSDGTYQAGNGGLNAGLIASIIPSSGSTTNFLIPNSKTNIASQGVLLAGLNIVADQNTRQSLCANLNITTLQINRCVNISGVTVKCP